MFEHYRQPLISRIIFLKRVFICLIISVIVLSVTIFIGAAVYRYLEGYSWTDAVLNSVMIMTGVGTIGDLHRNAVKIFTSFYSLLSTIIFFLVLGFLFSPLLHRFLHRFHLEIEKK